MATSLKLVHVLSDEATAHDLEASEEAEDEANPNNWDALLSRFERVERTQLGQSTVRQELYEAKRVHKCQLRLIHRLRQC